MNMCSICVLFGLRYWISKIEKKFVESGLDPFSIMFYNLKVFF